MPVTNNRHTRGDMYTNIVFQTLMSGRARSVAVDRFDQLNESFEKIFFIDICS